MVVVEFPPNGWSRGSYLNVGCMWLWNMKQHISFDVGYRVNGFFPYENEEQFGPAADKLAAGALEKVGEYRGIFRSIHDVSNYYFENAPKSFWPCFPAAIAHSLAGRAEAGSWRADRFIFLRSAHRAELRSRPDVTAGKIGMWELIHAFIS